MNARYTKLVAHLSLIVCAFFTVNAVKAADFLLDPNYTGANGAPYMGYAGAYNSITAALGGAGVPSGASAQNINRLYIAPGTYNTANVTGVQLVNSDSNIALIGMSSNPANVVITSTLDAGYNPGTGAIGTLNSATLRLQGNNVSAGNITFANSTDTPAIVNGTFGFRAVTPQGNYTTANFQLSNAPAVALMVQGDQTAFQNCQFLGYQDTLWTAGGRAYFNNCTVSGDVDYIFGSGTAVFQNSTINLDGDHSGGTITAASTDKRTSNGMVFLNDTVTGNSVKNNPAIDPFGAANANGPAANSMYLGRPWGWSQPGGDAGTVFINTAMTPAIKSVGWLAWNSNETTSNTKNNGNPAEDSRYAEYNSTDLSSNPLNVSSRVTWSHQLTASQAAAYASVDNIFSFESGYPWYGAGYPSTDSSNPGTGSANPSDPNYSWPAYWGDRNIENDTNNVTVSGNPASYSDPAWTIQANWDPNAQLNSALNVPEPGSLALLFAVATLALRRVRRRGEGGMDDS